MLNDQSISIVGRGIAGLALSFELLKRGIPVNVFGPSSRRDCATAAAVGLSSLKGQWHANKPLFSAKVDGHVFLWSWLNTVESSAGLKIPRFCAYSYEPYWTMMEYARIRDRVFHREFSGHTGAVIGTGLVDLSRMFSEEPAGFAIYDRDIWFDPRICIEALERAIRNLGGGIFDEEISKISVAGRKIVLSGNQDTFKSDHVVVAAGVYSDRLLKNSEISGPKQKAVYGETLVADKFSHGSPHIIHMGQRHLVCWDGSARYGSSSKDIDMLAPPIDDTLKAGLNIDSRLSASGSANSFSTSYTGIRGRYRDISPCIGELNLAQSGRKIVLFSGFYKSGLQLAPLFASKLASYYAGSSAFLCDSQFSVSRFSSEF